MSQTKGNKEKQYSKEATMSEANEGMSNDPNLPSQEKPRHLEEETASYLLEIEAQFKAIVSTDQEAKEILVSNVLTEIQSRSASAACDRRTNFLFEQLCFYASPTQLIQLLQKWTHYSVFLARNRYASHIVQTVISRLCFFFQQSTIYSEVEASVVEETVVQFSRSLTQEMFWLGKEMSASHVIRSLICLLSGLPTIAEKKSKNSKHQHAVASSEPLDQMLAPNAFFVSELKTFAVPQAFKDEVLSGFQRLVTTKSKRDLQLFIADISSCALLTLLLKIITNPKIYPPQSTEPLLALFLEKLFDPSILKHVSSSDGAGVASDVFYAMAGDRLGSFFLETIITVLPFSSLVKPIIDKNLLGGGAGALQLKEYCFDNFGNYVIQGLLKRLHSEKMRAEGEDVREIVGKVLEEVQRMRGEVEAKEWRDLLRQRRGIFYWLLEVCVAHHCSEHLLVLAAQLLADWKADQDESEGGSAVTVSVEEVQALLSSSSSSSSNPSYAALLSSLSHFLDRKFTEKATSSTPPSSSSAKEGSKGEEAVARGEEETGGVTGEKLLLAKMLRLFLLQTSSEGLGSLVCQSILALSPPALTVIINTSQLNKNIIDTVLLAPPPRQWWKLFSMRMADETIFPLFLHSFYGLKNLKAVYERCDVRGRDKWMTLLQTSKPQLSKTKDGRLLAEITHLDLYLRDSKEWRAVVKAELKTSASSSDAVSNTAPTKTENNKRKRGDDEQDGEKEITEDKDVKGVEGVNDGEKKKRKRKRQRKSKAGQSDTNANENDDGEEDEED